MGKETYAERIKQLREEDGLTQLQLAKATECSKTAINYWENSERVPNANAVIRLAEYFGVTTDYLLGVSDKMD